jgi:3-methylcrotonyl-CoA carboxylase alpha subunit
MTAFSLDADGVVHRHTARIGAPISVDGVAHPVRPIDGGLHAVGIDGRTARVIAVAHGDTVYLQLDGRCCTVRRVDPARGAGESAGAGGAVATAPMPGVVVSWIAHPGATVRDGDPLLVIESMKLQATLSAPRDGVVEAMPFEPGQTFQRGAVLARLHEPEGTR